MVDNVYIFITGLTFLFIVIVMAYFLNTKNKKNIILKKKFMLGHWQREGTAPSTGETWQFDYIIDEHSIEMKGKNPDFRSKGYYRVLKEDEHLLTVYLEKIQGDGDLNPRGMSIAVDKAKNKIYIDGRLYKKANLS